MAQAIEDYRTSNKFRQLRSNTQQSYDINIDKWLLPRLGRKKIVDLTPHDLLEFTEAIRGKGSARLCIIVLKNSWKFATAFGRIPYNKTPPFDAYNLLNPGWDASGVRNVDLTDNDIRKLWEATYIYDRYISEQEQRMCTGYYGAAIRFALTTGLRKSNITHLMWDQVADRSISIPSSEMKGKRDFTVPLNPVA